MNDERKEETKGELGNEVFGEGVRVGVIGTDDARSSLAVHDVASNFIAYTYGMASLEIFQPFQCDLKLSPKSGGQRKVLAWRHLLREGNY